jgi:hypothetical protein
VRYDVFVAIECASCLQVITWRSVAGGCQLSVRASCLSLDFTLKVEAVCSSETVIVTYKTAWSYKVQDHKPQV